MKKPTRVDIRVAALRLGALLAASALPALAFTDGVPAAPAAGNDAAAVTIPAGAGAGVDERDAAARDAFTVADWDGVELGGISRDIFALALQAASAAIARGDAADPATLTVIDFSRPSTEPRMWVYDLRSRGLLFEELVSHGRGSGRERSTYFSNVPGSYQSSLGLFRTAEAYVGSNGYSLRLDGLEAGVNDRARERAIVIHGAPYVNPAAARAQGYLGRSHGCPAVRPEIARELIDTVKGGSLVFAYYPDADWLASSQYL